MKNLLCLLLALLLMLALPGGSLISNDKPFDEETGGGDPDDDPEGEDHPWGGDQIPINDPKPEYEVCAAPAEEMSYRSVIVISFFTTFFDAIIYRIEPDSDSRTSPSATSGWTTQVDVNSNDFSGGTSR